MAHVWLLQLLGPRCWPAAAWSLWSRLGAVTVQRDRGGRSAAWDPLPGSGGYAILHTPVMLPREPRRLSNQTHGERRAQG